jgi:hypothetical protein
MELDNLIFIFVFIVIPLGLGIWALMNRRELMRRGRSLRRRVVSRPQSEDQPTSQLPGEQPVDAQATTQIPQRDWASHVQPVRQTTPSIARLNRRRFYTTRYFGRSGGVVKRVTPRAARSFLRVRSASQR